MDASFGLARVTQCADLSPAGVFSLFASLPSLMPTLATPSLSEGGDDRSISQLVAQQVKFLLGPPGKRVEV